MRIIELTVREDLLLSINTPDAGHAGEHNAVKFNIKQPDFLDKYTCRVEISTKNGGTWRMVEDRGFALTSDLAVAGNNRLQLVYYDGDDVVCKTSIRNYIISESVNAVEPSDGTFSDELARIMAIAESITSGKSAYDLAVKSGFEGTLEEWLESLRGKDGNDAVIPSGVTDGSEAKPGEVGEILTAQINLENHQITHATGTNHNILDLALPAGDWECWARLSYTNGSGNANLGIAYDMYFGINPATTSAFFFGREPVGNNSFGAGSRMFGPLRINSSASSSLLRILIRTFGQIGFFNITGTITARRMR